MKTKILAALLIGVSGPALAGAIVTIAEPSASIAPPASVGFGGIATAYYGWFSAPPESTMDYNSEEFFNVYGGEASFGKPGNGGFGWQVDILGEVGSLSDENEYWGLSGTLHGNVDVAGFTLGGFVGVGTSFFDHENYDFTSLWYGVEAAKTVGNFAFAAQVGLSDVDSSHDAIDSQGQLFGNVEGRYFLNDNAVLSANFGVATGMEHDNAITQYQFGAEGMIRLGQSNFYGSAAYRIAAYTDDGDISGEVEQIATLGISMLFGGNSLRETLTGNTPMLTTTAQMLMGIKAGTFD